MRSSSPTTASPTSPDVSARCARRCGRGDRSSSSTTRRSTRRSPRSTRRDARPRIVTSTRAPTTSGSAPAVNIAAARTDADYILLVNPDVELDGDAVDALLALAANFPDAGIYGGRATLPDGTVDPTTCLAAPTLWSAAAFGLGLSAIRFLPTPRPGIVGRLGTRLCPSVPASRAPCCCSTPGSGGSSAASTRPSSSTAKTSTSACGPRTTGARRCSRPRCATRTRRARARARSGAWSSSSPGG